VQYSPEAQSSVQGPLPHTSVHVDPAPQVAVHTSLPLHTKSHSPLAGHVHGCDVVHRSLMEPPLLLESLLLKPLPPSLVPPSELKALRPHGVAQFCRAHSRRLTSSEVHVAVSLGSHIVLLASTYVPFTHMQA